MFVKMLFDVLLYRFRCKDMVTPTHTTQVPHVLFFKMTGDMFKVSVIGINQLMTLVVKTRSFFAYTRFFSDVLGIGAFFKRGHCVSRGTL